MKRIALTICLLVCSLATADLVLVLRSWPRDPDLPQNLPDTSLPSNWNPGSPDWYQDTGTTLTNGTVTSSLQNLFDNFDSGANTLQPGDHIRLAAGEDYGTIVIPANVKGTSSEWIILYSDGYASLPAYGSRVTAADETYMATFSAAPTTAFNTPLVFSSGDGAAGCSYIRLIGIKIEATGSGYASTNYIGPVMWADYNNQDRTEHPEFIGLDRCVVTVDDDVDPWECQFNANDSFVVGCLWYNYWGGGNDGSNALRTYNGERLVVHNNKFECMGAAWFIGDGQNPDPDDCLDLSYTNNYHHHPTAWDDGGHGTTKSSFETKVAHRLLIANNVFENQAEASYNAGHAIISIKGEKNSSQHVTIRGNQCLNCYQALVVLAGASSGNDAESGPNTDILIEHNFVASSDNSFRIYVGDDAAGGPRLQRVQLLNNTLISSDAFDYAIEFREHNSGTTPGQKLICRDNIMVGGIFSEGVAEGAASLNAAWGSLYAATYNLLVGRSVNTYDDDASPAPSGTLSDNLFPANVAAVGFTDSVNGDYSLGGGSSYLESSSTGGEPGYDSDTYDPIWAAVNP